MSGKNWVAKDLRTPKYSQRVERDKTKYDRKDKSIKPEGDLDELQPIPESDDERASEGS